MRASDSDAVHRRLEPRAIRVRNRCLAALAARRALSVPTASDLERVGDDVSLGDAFASWAQMHPPAGRPSGPRIKRPLTSRLPVRAAAILFAAMLGVGVGTRWLPRARAQASGEVGAPVWLSVPDSVAGRVNERFLLMASSDMRLTANLSAAEIAAVIFNSRRTRVLPVDSLVARVDSALHVRGRVKGGASFELAGDLTLARRGIGELRVNRLVVDGVVVPPDQASRVLTRPRRHDVPSNLVSFDLPGFVTSLRVSGGAIEVAKRER